MKQVQEIFGAAKFLGIARLVSIASKSDWEKRGIYQDIIRRRWQRVNLISLHRGGAAAEQQFKEFHCNRLTDWVDVSAKGRSKTCSPNRESSTSVRQKTFSSSDS